MSLQKERNKHNKFAGPLVKLFCLCHRGGVVGTGNFSFNRLIHSYVLTVRAQMWLGEEHTL